MPATISVRDLHKSYGDVAAVDGVSFDVEPGEFFGILGPNGAGKTTTLEIIEGLRRPAHREALRRPGAAAVDRLRAGARPRAAFPRRADRCTRPAGQAQPVGPAAPDQQVGPDGGADHTPHGRGRVAVRPGRDHGSRQDPEGRPACRARARARPAAADQRPVRTDQPGPGIPRRRLHPAGLRAELGQAGVLRDAAALPGHRHAERDGPWRGPASALPAIGIMLGFTAVVGAIAVRVFRWDDI